MVSRAVSRPKACRSRWNGEGAWLSASDEAAAPNSVARPVPTTSAKAWPVCATAPRNSAFDASPALRAATTPGRFSTGYGSPVSAASLAVKAVASSSSASAGMMSPARTRTRSPGTTVSTSTGTKAPSRLTSALSATERRSSSAALTARPSWNVSRPIDSARIATMIEPPISSPVAAETTPAARRMSDSGSSKRRRMAAGTLARLTAASEFGPYCASRARASALPRPSGLQCNSAHSASFVRVQNGAAAGEMAIGPCSSSTA